MGWSRSGSVSSNDVGFALCESGVVDATRVSVPEAMMSGFPVPASAEPMASMAALSVAQAPT